MDLHKNKIQALHPRAKFHIAVFYSICSFIIGTIHLYGYPVFLTFWFFIIPILAAASGVFGIFLKGFLKILFISIFILLVQSVVIKSNNVILQFGFIKIYKEGLAKGITLGFSVMNTAGIFLWMFKTTTNKEISRALDDSGINPMFTYMFTSSLQMIEVLGKKSKVIINAQQARGVETQGSVIVRAKAFFIILVPLILASINAAEERVLTLESKGFGVKCPKTHIFELSPSPWDTPAKFISWTITAFVVIWRGLEWLR